MSVNATSELADKWMHKGQWHSIAGHQVFTIDSQIDRPVEKPVLCILHGFPTSSFDYWKVFDTLSEHYRVIVHDHLGFGFSAKPTNYSYSLVDQTDIALKLWQALGIKQATILAHDYGTSILTELIARDNIGLCPLTIEQVILCNGSMHIEMANLRLMQRLLRSKLLGSLVGQLASQKTLKRNLKNIFVDPNQITDEEISNIWRMMVYNNGKSVLPAISRYTLERQNLWHRWIGALTKSERSFHIVWPDKDPIAVAAMAEQLKLEIKHHKLTWLKNVGHFPMLEDPKQWLKAVLSKNN